MDLSWIFVHFLPTLGFVLALALLTRISREHRPPASAFAWLLAIVLIPYAGVPLYLLFGGRKIERAVRGKGRLPGAEAAKAEEKRQAGSGVFSPVTGNAVTLLTDGRSAFEETLRLIGEARHSIAVATFILGRDETGEAILRALARKAAEGVAVRLLLDGVGSLPVRRRFLAPLLDAGGQAAYFMPMIHLPFRGRANLRNHRKIVLADGRVAMVGGMNLAKEYMGRDADPARWRDLALRLEGPVAGQIGEVFDSDWAFAAKQVPPSRGCGESPPLQQGSGTLRLIASGPDVPQDALRDTLVSAVCKARDRVWAVTPYFVPDELLAEMLCMAARRGVDVRLVVPRRSNHRLADLAREAYLTALQEAGGTVLLYESGMLHAKATLVDDDRVITGSANMDVRSLLLNFEIAVAIESDPMVHEFERWMVGLMDGCTARQWSRSLPRDLAEGMGRLFAPLL